MCHTSPISVKRALDDCGQSSFVTIIPEPQIRFIFCFARRIWFLDLLVNEMVKANLDQSLALWQTAQHFVLFTEAVISHSLFIYCD